MTLACRNIFISVDVELYQAEAYSGLCKTSKMEHFARIVNGFYALTIFTKRSILNVRQGSGYASVRLYNILIILSSSHIYELNLFHLARLPFLDCRAKQTS